MNHQNIVFWKRDFSQLLTPLNLKYKVGPYSHAVIGGPKRAEIDVTGNEDDLWQLIEYIRNPVQIFSDKGDPVWWGYLAESKVDVGQSSVGVSIDSMYNYVGVVYEDDADNGNPKKTSWAEATDSTAEYGRRELLLTASESNVAAALAARDSELARLKYPMPVITSREKGPNSATLYCRGWFDTLAWRYYLDAGTASFDTATQIFVMAAVCGEFITGINPEMTSGIVTKETRDGNANAYYEITELLKRGTSNYRRMLCEVTIGRMLRVYEEPVMPSKPNLMPKDKSIRDPYDTPLRKETCPVGFWMRMKDVIPASVDTTMMADPTIQFIDEMEYIPSQDRLVPTPRGEIDPFKIGVPYDG